MTKLIRCARVSTRQQSTDRQEEEGPSPVIKGRVPADYLAAIKQLESQTGKSQSELVREGMTFLLKKHHLIGS